MVTSSEYEHLSIDQGPKFRRPGYPGGKKYESELVALLAPQRSNTRIPTMGDAWVACGG